MEKASWYWRKIAQILGKAYELAKNEYERFKRNQQLKNIIDQMLSRTTDTTFMNIIILKISIVFYLSQNILVLASFYI